MGTSTDAILFYGFCIEEGEPPPWYNEEDDESSEDWGDWEYIYARNKGLPDTYEGTRKALENEPCMIGYHCSSDCTEYYIAVNESEITARRGYPEIVSVEHLQQVAEKTWNNKLLDFCKVLGIETPERFDWHLVSYWG